LGLLLPLGPDVGADGAASGADHATAERLHRYMIGPRLDIKHGFVVALVTEDGEPTNAICPRVAERHGLDHLTSSHCVTGAFIQSDRAWGQRR